MLTARPFCSSLADNNPSMPSAFISCKHTPPQPNHCSACTNKIAVGAEARSAMLGAQGQHGRAAGAAAELPVLQLLPGHDAAPPAGAPLPLHPLRRRLDGRLRYRHRCRHARLRAGAPQSVQATWDLMEQLMQSSASNALFARNGGTEMKAITRYSQRHLAAMIVLGHTASLLLK